MTNIVLCPIMHFKNFCYYILLAVLLIQCKNKDNDELSQSEIDSIIHNPITATNATETYYTSISGGPFEFDAGEVIEGAVISHSFSYINTGRVMLEKTDIKSTCGCTVAAPGKDKIAPGSTDSITVSFDTRGFTGRQEKKITLFANTRPRETHFIIQADVKSSEK